MKSKLVIGTAVACMILLSNGPTFASMYYSWAEQFPWDRPETVNPDVISGALLSTSMHWPTLSNYGFYRPTFVPDRAYACRRGECRTQQRW